MVRRRGGLLNIALILAIAGMLVWAAHAMSEDAPGKRLPSSCRVSIAKKRAYGVEVTTFTRVCRLPTGARLPANR